MKKKKTAVIIVIVLLIVLVLAFFLLSSKKINAFGKYCTVEFSGVKEKIKSRTVKCGNPVGVVETPEKEGYVFLGWYDGDEEFDFDDTVDEDIVLVAKWESEEDPEVVAVTGLTVEKNSVSIKEKQTMTLKAKVTPEDATNTKLLWSSSDEKIVKVDKTGTIVGVSVGTATITVKTEDGDFKEEIKVEVTKNITEIKFNDEELYLTVGQSKTISIHTVPSDLKVEKYVWSSSNEAVAKVDSTGKITAVGVGQATVTVKAEKEGFSASLIVNVVTPVTGVSLNTSSLNLNKGESATLVATVSPGNATNKAVTWSSSDSMIATVDGNGKVTGLRAGTVDITVTTRDGGFKATAKVVIKDPNPPPVVVVPTEVVFDKSNYVLECGESVRVKATVLPENSTNKMLSWSSSNPGVATVDGDGIVTALSTGTTTIYATAVSGGKKAMAVVKVIAHVVDISLNEHILNLTVGQSSTLTATIIPDTAENKKVTWSSSDTGVATVDQNGKVVAVSEGTTTIIVKAEDGGLIDTATVIVTNEIIHVTSVSLNKTSFNMNIGTTTSLTATVYPENATDKRVKWSSSNNNVVAVDEKGNLTAKAAGTATITVRSYDGSKTSSATVTVTSAFIDVTGVSLNKTSLTMNVGDHQTLSAAVLPKNATNQELSWSSNKPNIVTVDQKGNLTAVAAGEAIITVTTVSGNKEANARVVVVQPVTDLIVSTNSLNLVVGNSDNIGVTIVPEDATDKRVKWSSSDTSVATVDENGNVTAKKAGTAQITVKTYDNTKTRYVSVTVSDRTINVTGITLDKSSVSIAANSSTTVKANVMPTNATDKSVSWHTGNSSVAEVSSSGVITGKSVGTTVVTACTADGGFCASVNVTVTKAVVRVVSVSLDQTYISMVVGETAKLTATVLPSNADEKGVKWNSNRTSIATVDNDGTITGVGTGVATITVTTNDGNFQKTATVNVVAAPIAVQSVTLDKSELNINIGDTASLKATVNPNDATNKAVTWSSNNTSVATVSSTGVVTGKSVGDAVITVTTKDGNKTASATVHVNRVSVTGVTLSKTAISLGVGGSGTLSATVYPTNATDKSVTWSSDNTSVATVSSTGVVTAKAIGIANITVTTRDGNKKASASVTVSSNEINVTGVSISPSTATINVGETKTLTANILPTNATNKKVYWSSSNTSVATISSDGVVTAKSEGSTTITVRTDNGGKTATATIYVTQPVTGVSVTPTSLSLYVGNTAKVTAKVLPTNATNKEVTWSSSNTSVATVDNTGSVTAKAAGTATITVTTKDGNKKATVAVTVKEQVISVTSVSVAPTSLSLYTGNTATLTATVYPTNATNKGVTWSSSNTSVATVSSSGVVTAKGAGTAIITVTTKDGGKTATTSVTVTTPVINVTGVQLNKSSLSLDVGQNETLVATVLPTNASNKDVKWSTSNTSVATVDSSGKVTAKSAGTAIITVTTVDGRKTATATVTVQKPTIHVTGVSLSKTSLTLNVGVSEKLTATIYPTNATNKDVSWSSANPSVAKVDSNGNVTGVSAGTTTITVTTADGGKTAQASVTVKTPSISVTGVTLNKSTLKLAVGKYETLVATVMPTNATNKNVSWKSSNTSVATVDSTGRVTAKAVGTTVITVTTADGNKTAQATVTVYKPVTGVNLNKTTLSLEVGKSETLIATVLPSDATEKRVNWSSSNSKIVSVNSGGKVTAIAAGSATITVTTVDGSKTASVKVTVTSTVATVTLNKSDVYLSVGGTEKLTATSNPTGVTFTWSTDAAGVATVSNGTITAKGPGSAKITVKGSNGATATATVHVPAQFYGEGYAYNARPLDSNKSIYRGEFKGDNSSRVYQSWAYDNGYIYVSQRNAYITRISASEVYKNPPEGKTVQKKGSCIHFVRGGHLSNIDIEHADGNTYLWVIYEDALGTDDGNSDNYKVARIRIDNELFNSSTCKNIELNNSRVQYYNYKGNVAVDDVNRKIAIRTGNRAKGVYNVYDLDAFVAQSKLATNLPSKQFTVTNHVPGNKNQAEDSDNLLGWQGMEIDNNYIYILEGYDAATISAKANGKNYGAFVSVYNIEGKEFVYRKNIRYPATATVAPLTRYFEPEGIKVYNNKLFVGFTSKETGNPKEYIYQITTNEDKITDNVNNKIHFININSRIESNGTIQAGDAILLQSVNSSGKVVYGLIDTGPSEDADKLVKYLGDAGVKRLEWVIITHMHADHYQGVKKLVQMGIPIGKFYLKKHSNYDQDAKTRYETVTDWITDAKYTVADVNSLPKTVTGETSLELGQYRLALFNTTSIYDEIYKIIGISKNNSTSDICYNLYKTGSSSYCSENANSVAILVTLGNRNIYLTGDLGNLPASLENACLSKCKDEDCNKCSFAKYIGNRVLSRAQNIDIYKTAHHGRNSNNNKELIKMLTRDGTTPFQYAVVTGGISTTNDNPKVALVKERMINYKVTNFLTTHDDGNIIFTIYNNKAITVSTKK